MPLVSTKYFCPTKKETVHQAAKKKKIIAGVDKASFKMGNKNITSAAAAQLLSVLIEIYFGYKIYGMYSQTTGPSERPKFAMKMMSPEMISAFPASLELSWMRKPMAIRTKDATPAIVPA